MSIARTHDGFRQQAIGDILHAAVTAEKLFLILGSKVIGTLETDKREDAVASIGTVKNVTKIEAAYISKAVLKDGGVPSAPSGTTQKLIANKEYYVATTPGLDISLSKANLWNAVYGEVPLEENDRLNPTEYNTITIAITDNTSGTVNGNTIIITQTYIAPTTLPYTDAETMKVLIQL